MCRSLTCSLFFPNMIIKTRSGLEFPKIYKPRASKGVLPSHPNPRQRFKHLGLMTTPFWLLDFPSTPDHRNTVPETCIEPHPSRFSPGAQQLLWPFTLRLHCQPKTSVSPEELRQSMLSLQCALVCFSPRSGSGVERRRVLIAMASAACGHLPSAQLHASEFGNLNW